MKINVRITTNLAERELVSRAIENKRQQTTLNYNSTFDDFWNQISQGSILEQHIGSVILDQEKQKEINDAIEKEGDVGIESTLNSKDLKELKYYLKPYVGKNTDDGDYENAVHLAEKAHINLD